MDNINIKKPTQNKGLTDEQAILKQKIINAVIENIQDDFVENKELRDALVEFKNNLFKKDLMLFRQPSTDYTIGETVYLLHDNMYMLECKTAGRTAAYNLFDVPSSVEDTTYRHVIDPDTNDEYDCFTDGEVDWILRPKAITPYFLKQLKIKKYDDDSILVDAGQNDNVNKAFLAFTAVTDNIEVSSTNRINYSPDLYFDVENEKLHFSGLFDAAGVNSIVRSLTEQGSTATKTNLANFVANILKNSISEDAKALLADAVVKALDKLDMATVLPSGFIDVIMSSIQLASEDQVVAIASRDL